MSKTVANIVADVRLAIDEVGVNDAEFFSGSDETQLKNLIISKLCEAVDWVHSSAALELMAGDVFEHGTVSSSGLSVTDMIRFVQARGYGWTNAVRELTEEGTEEYFLAVDEYVGASVERPAVVLEYVDGGRLLSLLPVDSSHNGNAVYVNRLAVPSGGWQDSSTVAVDSNLYTAMVEYLGGLVLMVLNDDRGENLIQLAKSMIGLDVNKNGN